MFFGAFPVGEEHGLAAGALLALEQRGLGGVQFLFAEILVVQDFAVLGQGVAQRSQTFLDGFAFFVKGGEGLDVFAPGGLAGSLAGPHVAFDFGHTQAGGFDLVVEMVQVGERLTDVLGFVADEFAPRVAAERGIGAVE